MLWSHEKCLGASLAATLWDDRTLAHVAGALPSPEEAAIRATLLPLEHADTEAKIRLLRSLAERVRGEPGRSEALPPRARALLARRVPKLLGRTWIEQAQPARSDFTPEPELLETLLHIASSSDPE